jgi:hypothetical protein
MFLVGMFCSGGIDGGRAWSEVAEEKEQDTRDREGPYKGGVD